MESLPFDGLPAKRRPWYENRTIPSRESDHNAFWLAFVAALRTRSTASARERCKVNRALPLVTGTRANASFSL
jgi:hypothetical protein